jgi:hydroxymethylpyrimidine/phosphomethylpyrimidine kinase
VLNPEQPFTIIRTQHSGLIMKVALSIAGFDPTGGAGVIADVKTFAALECYGLAAVTAITVQNTVGVHSVEPLAPQLIIDQLQALFDDIKIDAVKIGMLATSEITLALSDFLSQKMPPFIVIDTPFRASSGHPLLDSEAVQLFIERLFPLASLITPNLGEAEILSKQKVTSLNTMKVAAKRLREMGASAVLIKGGHLQGEPIDLLFNGNDYHEFRAERIEGVEAHGTGCALSSALAAFLARGFTLSESVAKAKEFVTSAIANIQILGRGSGLPDHFISHRSHRDHRDSL